ncbi:MAG: hypothetical protein N4A31_06225 [Rickettsiales bacterium]|jgi:hypothetical protein|nr:hypothetical protein [Rickettsiales bacterium]
MSVRKEDQEKKESLLGSVTNFFLRREETNLPKEEDTSFLSMARQLRAQKEEESKESEALQRDISDWLAGEAMKMLHITGTALEERIHNMIMGESTHNNSEGGE